MFLYVILDEFIFCEVVIYEVSVGKIVGVVLLISNPVDVTFDGDVLLVNVCVYVNDVLLVKVGVRVDITGEVNVDVDDVFSIEINVFEDVDDVSLVRMDVEVDAVVVVVIVVVDMNDLLLVGIGGNALV